MRRLLLVVTLGLLTLPVAACADNSPNASATTPAPATSTDSGNTEEVCKEIEAVFDQTTFEPLGASIGELIVYREAGDAAKVAETETKIKGQITAIADKFTAAAEKADDPELKAKLTGIAAQVTTATDLKFLENVKSPEDIEAPLTTMLMGWITPLATTCQMS